MKIVETNGVTVALAEWIIDDFSVLYLLSIKVHWIDFNDPRGQVQLLKVAKQNKY